MSLLHSLPSLRLQGKSSCEGTSGHPRRASTMASTSLSRSLRQTGSLWGKIEVQIRAVFSCSMNSHAIPWGTTATFMEREKEALIWTSIFPQRLPVCLSRREREVLAIMDARRRWTDLLGFSWIREEDTLKQKHPFNRLHSPFTLSFDKRSGETRVQATSLSDHQVRCCRRGSERKPCSRGSA